MPRAALEHFFARTAPSVTVLIPSYKEDERIIRTTVLSAALQDYPGLRVVLLIDDPAHPTRRKDRLLLEQARSVAASVQELLDEPAHPGHGRDGRLRAARPADPARALRHERCRRRSTTRPPSG